MIIIQNVRGKSMDVRVKNMHKEHLLLISVTEAVMLCFILTSD